MTTRLEQLQTLSDAATAYVVDKYGSTSRRCVEGRHHLFMAARKMGLMVEKAQGFYWGNQHNWVYDPQTEVIIDPTASQFGRHDGVIMPDDRAYKLYDPVPKKWLNELGYQPSFQHQRWLTAKRWIKAGTTPNEEWGEDKIEWRISKRGDHYLYFQRKVHFDKYPTEHVRSGLVFTTKDGGYHLTITLQRRVMVNYKVYRPTRIKHYYISPHGALLMSFRNKWQPYRDSQGYYFTPEEFVGQLPPEVQAHILNHNLTEVA